MTVSIRDQLRDYADQVTSHSVPVDLDQIVLGDPVTPPVTQTVGAWPKDPTEPVGSKRPRGWLVAAATAAAVLVLASSAAWLFRR